MRINLPTLVAAPMTGKFPGSESQGPAGESQPAHTEMVSAVRVWAGCPSSPDLSASVPEVCRGQS